MHLQAWETLPEQIGQLQLLKGIFHGVKNTSEVSWKALDLL